MPGFLVFMMSNKLLFENFHYESILTSAVTRHDPVRHDPGYDVKNRLFGN